MAKEIKITFYTPKELLQKFCNWVFWPRRKECAGWCEYYDGVLVCKVKEIIDEEVNLTNISREVADRLYYRISDASGEICKNTAEMMSRPF